MSAETSPRELHDEGEVARRRLPRWVWPAGVLAVYLVASFVLNIHAWVDPRGRVPAFGDAYLSIWWLAWVPHAVLGGHSPFLTHAMNYPRVVNGMWNTSVPLLALLATPVTLLAGPVVAFNVLLSLGPVVSAWVCFMVLRRYVRRSLVAAAAGFVYGFGPYETTGHLHLVWAFLPPLLIYFVDEVVVRQRVHWLKVGVALGLVCAAQALIAEEVLATSALVAAIAVLALAALNVRLIRGRVAHMARVAGTATVSFLVVMAYPLSVQFNGPGRVHGAIQHPNVYVNDLLGFLVPARGLIRWSATRDLAGRFSANTSEHTSFLGPVLLVLFVVAVVALRRRLIVRVATLTAVVLAVLSFGPSLHIAGHDTGMRLPWAVADATPVLQNALPARLSVYVMLAVVLVVALWWDDVLQRDTRRGGLATGAIVLAAVTLLPAGYRAPRLIRPGAFVRHHGTAIPAHLAVMAVPYTTPQHPEAMLWQAESRMRFNLFGGYFVGPDRRGQARFGGPEPALGGLLTRVYDGAPPPAPGDRRLLAALDVARRDGVRGVVVEGGGHTPDVLSLLRRLGTSPRDIGGVWFAPLAPRAGRSHRPPHPPERHRHRTPPAKARPARAHGH